jgi:hypothetical protein
MEFKRVDNYCLSSFSNRKDRDTECLDHRKVSEVAMSILAAAALFTCVNAIGKCRS